MNYLHLGVYFWFDICDEELKLLDSLNNKFKHVFKEFEYDETKESDIYLPIISAYDKDTKTHMAISRICCQYHLDSINNDNISKFKDNCLELFDILIDNNINILYVSANISAILNKNNPIDELKKMFNTNIEFNNMLEMNLKFTSLFEDQYNETLQIVNNKKVEFTKIVDSKDREIPFNLLPLGNCNVVDEVFMFEYELSDRYLFDTSKDYKTTPFHLNKILYIIKDNFDKSIDKYLNIH